MDDVRLWIIFGVSLAGFIFSVISSYAIHVNDLKHLKDRLNCLESKFDKQLDEIKSWIRKLEDRIWPKQ